MKKLILTILITMLTTSAYGQRHGCRSNKTNPIAALIDKTPSMISCNITALSSVLSKNSRNKAFNVNVYLLWML